MHAATQSAQPVAAPPVEAVQAVPAIKQPTQPNGQGHKRKDEERGMSTAEYAVGTLGACTIGGILVKIGQSDWFGELVKDVLSSIPDLLPF